MRSIQLVHTYQTIVLEVRRPYEQWPNIGPNLVGHRRSNADGQYSCGHDPSCRDWSPPPAAGQEIIIAKVGKPVADLGPLAAREENAVSAPSTSAPTSSTGSALRNTTSFGLYRDSGRPGRVLHHRAADRHRDARDGTSTYVAEREL
jgi:antitoxin (DNA-binding transcriptional repressor) of toxin-antitoxin stability system